MPEPAHPATVLIVDDEELYLRALAEDQRRRGARVITRRDAPSALPALQELSHASGPILLLLDLVMPGLRGGYLGGLDLLREGDLPPGADIRALCDSEAVWLPRAAESLGAGAVILKPDLRRTPPEHLDLEMRRFLARLAGETPPEALRGGEQEVAGVSMPAAASTSHDSLLGALEELAHVQDRTSALLLMLRLAAEVTPRGVLLEVDGDALRALGAYGLESEAEGRAGTLQVALDRDTLAGRAFWSARTQSLGAGEGGDLRLDLVSDPGGSGAMAVPVLGPAGVAAILYAETGAGNTDLRPLSALAGAVALALNRAEPPISAPV